MVIVYFNKKLLNMKKFIHSIIVVCGFIIIFSGCKPEKIELGPALDKSALKFTVTPSANNPNDIVLKSLTPNATPYWVSPSGNSTKLTDTINIPFPGEYIIKYAVQSRGGLVYADSVKVTIASIDANTVSDLLWVNLTGGLGKSKTWRLDVDATGKSLFFNGPVYFAGENMSWEWQAGWANWIIDAGDYGTMTFDLIGNPNFTSNNLMFPALSGTGKFMLDTKTKTLSTIGAEVLHDKNSNNGTQGAQVANWKKDIRIKSLTATQLQLVAVRNDGTWLLYNYYSQ
jgi:hypothetical protein